MSRTGIDGGGGNEGGEEGGGDGGGEGGGGDGGGEGGGEGGGDGGGEGGGEGGGGEGAGKIESTLSTGPAATTITFSAVIRSTRVAASRRSIPDSSFRYTKSVQPTSNIPSAGACG